MSNGRSCTLFLGICKSLFLSTELIECLYCWPVSCFYTDYLELYFDKELPALLASIGSYITFALSSSLVVTLGEVSNSSSE